MEYILEMNEANQLAIPDSLVGELGLEPGAHFAARLEGSQLIIERVPFSSQEQARILDKTMDGLQKDV
jgi:antitoxin component of MazEF toxin-antitoxin module